ncbi:ABC transporter permease [Streptomyces sp. NPDC089919]|uniref:ABC transporter permease n=1 Tax=Streptomyces sp. NPDC089919 TaxID=3155188 RepID=UPI0034242E3D
MTSPTTAPTRPATENRAARTPAPWVRTRLRTSPAAALALAVLVLVTAFLAAALPRAVDGYESLALRHAVEDAPATATAVEVTTPRPGLELSPAKQEAALLPPPLDAVQSRLLAALPAPLRADPGQSAHGVRTTTALVATDSWLPRLEERPPRFTVDAQSGLADHATVVSGRLPGARGAVTARTRNVEAAASTETAATLHLRVGSVVHLLADGPLAVTITGIVEPRTPGGSYWSAKPILRTPGQLMARSGVIPAPYWHGALLLAPEAAPALLGTTGKFERYWRFAPAADGLTAADAPTLVKRIASLEGGPDLLRMRAVAGSTAVVSTDLETVLADQNAARDAVADVVAVAAAGTGAVAAVVIAMAGSLVAARRRDELALLRARGGSLAGIGLRLLGEAAVTALPAAAAGLLAALLLLDGSRWLPAALGAGAVALLACVVLPLPAVLAHRKPRVHGLRDDLATARPGRARTVAELTALVLAAAALQTLRSQDAAGGPLAAAAPVLVALTAALVAVRLYPLPLRWAARPARRLRGAVGFLALARAGRAPAAGVLPLLALLVALTTAALGGSVLAGVEGARDRTALLTTGADVRVSTIGDLTPLPAQTAAAVAGVRGIEEVTALRFDRSATQIPAPATGRRVLTLIGVQPEPYARLARHTGLGGFPATALARTGGVLDAVASPALAARLGSGPHQVAALGGTVTVRVVAVRDTTPAAPRSEFLLVDSAGLPGPGTGTTTLLATGAHPDPAALRAAAAGQPVQIKSTVRAAFADTPLQKGAGRLYTAAIAAGAGYAAVALLLSLLRSAPERTALLARLGTLGMGRRQSRTLLLLEALPQTLLAAAGGLLTAWATIRLVAPGIDLTRLALTAAAEPGTADGIALHADAWSLALPAAGVVALSVAVAAAQAWWPDRRRTPSKKPVPGETR